LGDELGLLDESTDRPSTPAVQFQPSRREANAYDFIRLQEMQIVDFRNSSAPAEDRNAAEDLVLAVEDDLLDIDDLDGPLELDEPSEQM
jgi:hypothetical protein